MILGVDSQRGAGMVSSLAQEEGVTMKVRLEVEHLDLTGIYTYRGAVLGDGTPTLDLAEAGRLEGEFMVSVAEEIRETGVPIVDVSLGSTPTAEHAAKVDGVTEIRPGTYVFYDRMQTEMGACSLSDCAMRVVVTVVSRPRPDLAIIDGGSKTFATDVQPKVAPLGLVGFGHVVGDPNAVLERVTEEHGMLSVDEGSDLRVGDTVEIIPNHVCSTVNLHDEAYVQDAGGSTEKVRVAARGMVR
jgi:D-serine deaminase-like pyridoxal phosphate-dependent protein